MQRPLLPIALCAVVGMILGFILPHTSERVGSMVMSLTFSSLTLGWVITDAKQRRVVLGSFLPVAILLLSPVGVLWYGIRSRRWFFWRPVGYFCVLLLVFLLPILLVEIAIQQMSVVSPPPYPPR